MLDLMRAYTHREVEAAMKIAVEAEREACAEIAENTCGTVMQGVEADLTCEAIAKAIRARSKAESDV